MIKLNGLLFNKFLLVWLKNLADRIKELASYPENGHSRHNSANNIVVF